MEFFDISSNKPLFSSYLDFYDIKQIFQNSYNHLITLIPLMRGFMSVLDILPAASEEDGEASPPETV